MNNNKLLLLSKQSKNLPTLLLCLLLLIMVGLPILILFLQSFQERGTLTFFTSNPTFDNYRTVFASSFTYELLWNSILFIIGSLAIALVIALIMAFLVERTDLPYKEYAYVAAFLPMAIPGAITAIGWTFLLNPTNGMINVWIRSLLNLDIAQGPINIYSYGGMIFIAGISFAPTMFLMLSSIMKNLDPSLEEAAMSSGADKFGVARYVVLPLLRPGILSVFIFFFIILLETLEIPLVLGMNVDFTVLSVEIYNASVGGAREIPNYELACTFAVVILIIGICLILMYFFFTRQAERYAVITGKGYKSKAYKLGKWKYAALLFLGSYFLMKLVLPVVVLLWSSLLPYYQAISFEGFKMLNFDNYRELFGLQTFNKAVANTIVLVLVTSLATMLLASLISWIVVREKGVLPKALDVLAFMPNLLPGVVLGIALILASIGTPLYGTLTVLIFGFIIRYITFAVRMMSGLFFQISVELEDAASASGANKATIFFRIILPLLFPAFVNGFLWVGSHTMRDLTLPIFLMSTSNVVFASLIWQTWASGSHEVTASVSVLLVITLLFVVTPVQMYMARRNKT